MNKIYIKRLIIKKKIKIQFLKIIKIYYKYRFLKIGKIFLNKNKWKINKYPNYKKFKIIHNFNWI